MLTECMHNIHIVLNNHEFIFLPVTRYSLVKSFDNMPFHNSDKYFRHCFLTERTFYTKTIAVIIILPNE